MNVILIALYVIFAVGGSSLIKYGSLSKVTSILTLPIVNVSFSLISLVGILCYGLSFLLYIILLSKFDLSFISPLTVGLVYVLLMITAAFFFQEQFTLLKFTGCLIILAGILMIVSGK